MEKVLILGASGLVGKALIKELREEYEIYGTFNEHPIQELETNSFSLDVENLNEVIMLLEKIKPNRVISCLRGDFEAQLKVHKVVADYLKKNQGILYYCSTANVFDQYIDKAHVETDHVGAESDYGQFKIRCEKMLEEVLDQLLCILRLPMIWGKDSPRFNALKNQLEEGKEIEVYENLYKTSNTDVFLAKQIHYLMKQNKRGIYHLATNDVINHKDFIMRLIRELGYNDVTIKGETLPVDEYYLAIIPRDNSLPEGLQITNEQIISYLTNNESR